MILLFASLALALDHYVVRPGDTVQKIATRKRVEEADLRALNGLERGGEPPVGTVLLLPGPHDDDPAAVVIALSGTGNATRPGATPEALSITSRFPAGTLVCTDPTSFATLRLATAKNTRAHDEITLLAGTCLTVDAAWADPDDHASVVSVQKGSVAVRASLAGEGSVTVRTGEGVSTSETGGFRVTVEEGAARTEALEGEVSVVGTGGAVSVPTGFGTRVRRGEAPSVPVPLLAPGSPERPAEGEPLRRPDFTWSAVERALGYRVEIATTPDFVDIVFSEDVGAPPWRPDTLFLPFRGAGLWWRVASFDRTGFLGIPSEPRRITLPPGVGP